MIKEAGTRPAWREREHRVAATRVSQFRNSSPDYTEGAQHTPQEARRNPA
jgi:hypothetical protein